MARFRWLIVSVVTPPRGEAVMTATKSIALVLVGLATVMTPGRAPAQGVSGASCTRAFSLRKWEGGPARV